MILIKGILDILAEVIFWGTVAFAGLFFLRVLLAWVGANPFGRLSYHLTRITEPLVRPLRYQFGGRTTRYDLVPLVVGVMILVTGLFVSSMIGQLSVILYVIGGNALAGKLFSAAVLRELIRLVGLLYILAIFLRFFLPFFGTGYSNKFFRFLFSITEPLLKPIRRFAVAGMMDFSPLVAMIIVQIVTNVVAGLVA